MASRASLNKVLLIGNLTRDPELRYTPNGAAVCTFGLATNRTYVSSDGTRKEEAEFMRIVSWNKLAELCSQLLRKGRKVYVEGRMQTRSWETPDGQNRQTTEVVIDDMRILDSRRDFGEPAAGGDSGEVEIGEAVSLPVATEQAIAGATQGEAEEPGKSDKKQKRKEPKAKLEDKKKADEQENPETSEKVDLDDLPF